MERMPPMGFAYRKRSGMRPDDGRGIAKQTIPRIFPGLFPGPLASLLARERSYTEAVSPAEECRLDESAGQSDA